MSEKLVSGDVFTSIHIEEFEIEARDTRLGNEEVTRDIPNVGEEALRNLDLVFPGKDNTGLLFPVPESAIDDPDVLDGMGRFVIVGTNLNIVHSRYSL